MQLAEQLSAYFTRAAVRGRFDWAANNCCQFAARWVAEIEGADPMAGSPATPTPRAARALIRHLGGIVAAITHRLQREPVAAAAAQLGDVVLYQWAEGRRRRISVGLCNGRTSMLIDDAGAQLTINTLACSHAWRLDPSGAHAQTSAPPP